MRQFERSGVTIDQCAECRGIFLDRGELEHLIDADAKFNAQADAPPAAPPPPAQPATPAPQQAPPPPVGGYPPPPSPYGHGGYGTPHYKHGGYGARYKHGYGYGHKRKRRKSFFEELFD